MKYSRIVLAGPLLLVSLLGMQPGDAKAQSASFELGKRVGDFIGNSVAADTFKTTTCREQIARNNAGFFRQRNFEDALAYVGKRYGSNSDVRAMLANKQELERFRRELAEETYRSMMKELGSKPNPGICGVINGQVDARLAAAMKALP